MDATDGGNAHGGRQTCHRRDHHRGGGDTGGVQFGLSRVERAAATPAKASAVTTTDADWKPVADALGRSGSSGDNNTAYRINLPRNDLHITSYGVDIKPGLSLGGTRHSPDATTTKRCDGRPRDHRGELPKVTTECVAGAWYRPNRTAQASAATRPMVVDPFMGDAARLWGSGGVGCHNDRPPAPPPARQPPVGLDVAGVDQALAQRNSRW